MKKFILWIVLAILGAQLVTPVLASLSKWLYYDDGVCDAWGMWSNTPETPMKAVFFTGIETWKYARVSEVKYWIEENPDYPFKLHIMDSSWEDIYTGTYTPSQTGWNTIDLRGKEVIVRIQFIIGIEFNPIPDGDGYSYPPDLGGDSDDPDIGHSWIWFHYPAGAPSIDVNTDVMIRAEIEPFVVGGGLIYVDKLGLLAPYVGLASTILVATVAAAMYLKHVKRLEKKG